MYSVYVFCLHKTKLPLWTLGFVFESLKDGAYIRHWIPELRIDLRGSWIQIETELPSCLDI